LPDRLDGLLVDRVILFNRLLINKERLRQSVLLSELLGVLGDQILGHLAAEVRLLVIFFVLSFFNFNFSEIVRHLFELLCDLSAGHVGHQWFLPAGILRHCDEVPAEPKEVQLEEHFKDLPEVCVFFGQEFVDENRHHCEKVEEHLPLADVDMWISFEDLSEPIEREDQEARDEDNIEALEEQDC
jgi:hypothetical protein